MFGSNLVGRQKGKRQLGRRLQRALSIRVRPDWMAIAKTLNSLLKRLECPRNCTRARMESGKTEDRSCKMELKRHI